MKQPDALNQVAEFHHTFQHPVLNKPSIPAPERCELRVALIAEELKELQEAIDQNDLVEVADALCDLQYVLSGAILEFGLADKFKELFEEVQRSNMSKACKTPAEAEQTIAYYRNEKDTECYYREVDGLYLVYRKGDNKTIKSIGYSPANLKKILEQP